MKIVACIKRVPTTESQAKIAGDGKSLDPAGFQYMTSFYDEIAVEQAIRTKEQHGGEVTILTLGPKDSSKEVREALARGADAGVILVDEAWGARDPRSTAKVLAAKIQELGANLVFVGRVATDRDHAAVGPMIATYLDWACATDVVELEVLDGKLRAKRETEYALETLELTLPAVITCNKGLNEPRYAGLKGIMAAKKKPLDEEAAAQVANQAQIEALSPPPERKPGRIVGEGPGAIPALLDALRNESQVL